MTTYDFAPESARITATPAVATRVFNRVIGIFHAWQNRRTFYRLGEMSDAELADIGLTRADLSVAIDLPFGSDPTVKLRSIASERIASIEELARRVA
ncbi:MAG TPA: DUF1127 domain-containing protein [Mesorhizobium sp.]|jgi:uncharacterized protein YjiS (DUF1127 family)|uniref:DUF1127 domain-containing protein n=1 Tax=Mesorhizobium sp. TaxID=1871066 RepID=UPI002DDDA66B|nr:DUF1127 domain-containing protein [Mesorhizobium sp.]HEV2505738.1 DUF1127 domain-containing protein [Mesorhizobium sp.]